MDDDFLISIGIDPSTIDYSGSDSPSNEQILKDIGYEDPGIVSQISDALGKLGSGVLGALKSKFTDPNTGNVNWKNVAAAAGGLYGAYQSQQTQPKTGYQGGIPKYEMVREGVQGSHYDPERRPGSGGQRYFSNTTYAAPGEAAATARATAKEQAEIDVIKTFLPKQFSDAEITDLARTEIAAAGAASVKDMGKVMTAMRTKYAGQMDLGKASSIVKGLLG